MKEKINNIFSDKRRHERRDTITTIEYVINGLYTDEVFEGVIANISESGFCLLSTNPLSKGEKIEIKNEKHVNCQTAAVRWSSENKNLYYIVGLECI
ncbi:MAG: PilZ domain-containing protein [Thermodesulfovibrionales bacterium]